MATYENAGRGLESDPDGLSDEAPLGPGCVWAATTLSEPQFPKGKAGTLLSRETMWTMQGWIAKDGKVWAQLSGEGSTSLFPPRFPLIDELPQLPLPTGQDPLQPDGDATPLTPHSITCSGYVSICSVLRMEFTRISSFGPAHRGL